MRVGCEDPFERFWKGYLAENCSSTVSVLVPYCSSTAPVLLSQYCFSTAPVLLQYCFSAVPILFLYSTSIAPVLFQCCPNTHPSFEYEGAAERSVAGTLSLDRRLMAQPAESTRPQKSWAPHKRLPQKPLSLLRVFREGVRGRLVF